MCRVGMTLPGTNAWPEKLLLGFILNRVGVDRFLVCINNSLNLQSEFWSV